MALWKEIVNLRKVISGSTTLFQLKKNPESGFLQEHVRIPDQEKSGSGVRIGISGSGFEKPWSSR